MAIKIKKSRHVLTLISTSELYRLLNVPKTRMLRAIREGVICPAGSLAVTMQLEKGPPSGSCCFCEESSTKKPHGFDSPNGD